MTQAANQLINALAWAQLHSSAAGTAGTANIITGVARQRVPWGTPTGSGNYSLVAMMLFTGGPANGTVYSVTLWDSLTGGTFLGEYVLTGDTAFNAAGQFQVTALDIVGTAG